MMRLTVPPIEVPPSHPFMNDVLGREPFAEKLLNLVKGTEEGLTVTLDAPWGEGKTTFLRMWRAMLSKQGIKSLYFDAFAQDYSGDAFIAIASELCSFAQADLKDDEDGKSKLESYKRKAAEISTALLGWGTQVGIKALTSGIVDVNELKKAFVSELQERIGSRERDREVHDTFKSSVNEIAARVSERTHAPVVFIIDELDRCRPLYAIEVIERIKHLFTTDGLFFLIAMHKRQLEEAVKCVYGQGIDAASYLQKFINLELRLPKKEGPLGDSTYRRYCEKLFGLHEMRGSEQGETFRHCMGLLSRHFHLSLREMEKCFSYLALVYILANRGQIEFPLFMSMLIVLKVTNAHMYDRLRRGDIGCPDFVRETALDGGNSEDMAKTEYIRKETEFFLMSEEELATQAEDPTTKRCLERRSWIGMNRREIVELHTNLIDAVAVS